LRRLLLLRSFPFRNQYRIKARIVVHLELAIHLEVRVPRASVRKQLVEAGGQIAALLLQTRKFLKRRIAMRLIDVRSRCLRGHRPNFERHDRHPIDHAPRGFAIEPRACSYLAFRLIGTDRLWIDKSEIKQQELVDAFGRIVARLIVFVDRALVGGDFGIARARAARKIFLVPKQAIVAMVLRNPMPDTCHVVRWRRGCSARPIRVRKTAMMKGNDRVARGFLGKIESHRKEKCEPVHRIASIITCFSTHTLLAAYPLVLTASPRKPLVVRLRNFIGDVVLMIPALERLEAAGYELHCVGKGWANSLLEGHGWSVTTYPKKFGERVRTLKSIRDRVAANNGDINAITFATSFSSAMDMRFAGLRAFGYAVEARSMFLARSAKIVYGEHAMHSYWRLAGALLHNDAPPPAQVNLRVSDAARSAASQALASAGVRAGYVVAVPFAGGTFEKLDKKWPHFAAFVDRLIESTGRDVVLAPGPDEIELSKRAFPRAKLLTSLALGPYAAVLEQSALTVSNDTGPGHMAASVGAKLLSVLSPTKVEQWGALGERVRVVQRYPEWPSVDEVAEAARALL
jgi:heptosyltransferase II